MTTVQFIFIITSAVLLISAWMVVSKRNMVHAALYLVLALFAVAVLFVLLEAGFFAVIQVLVYIGAIAILMIFAVMLTRNAASKEDGPGFNANSGWAAAAAILLFVGLYIMISGWPAVNAIAPDADTTGAVVDLGLKFFSADGYVVPSIVASMLLLAALFGSIVIAWQKKEVEE